jgi:glycosyltransferase involved in cell wall biosynthesis
MDGSGVGMTVDPGNPLPLVSIVTPCLNAEEFIAETLQSIREQDYPSIEHIVVDGGSTDRTMQIVEQYGAARVLSEPDSGQAEAINKGFALARGDVLAWLNADDVYCPGAVRRAVALLRAGGYALVYSAGTAIDGQGRLAWKWKVKEFEYGHYLNSWNFILQPTMFFTRDAFETVEGLNPELHYTMDYDLCLKVGRRFRVGWSDERWASLRIHPNSKSVARADRLWSEHVAVSRAHGGALLSPLYLHVLKTRHPRVAALLRSTEGSKGNVARLRQRSAAARRPLRRRGFRLFVRRVQELARGPDPGGGT